MLEIRLIGADEKADINIPNEPFVLFGRMVPSYGEGGWDFSARYLEPAEIHEMCFPDENYDYDKLKDHSVFVGAYAEGTCVGLVILQEAMFRYMYLYDLKVARAFRRKGVGAALIEKSKEICKMHGYRGLYTQGQDNNLAACQFYIKAGFYIGGLDTNVYKGTSAEGTADILFYLDC